MMPSISIEPGLSKTSEDLLFANYVNKLRIKSKLFDLDLNFKLKNLFMETLQKFEGDLNEHVKNAINVNRRNDSDCVDFDATFLGIGFAGTFCTESLTLTVSIKLLGITISTQKFNLRDGSFCNTISVGFEWINFCFGVRNGCLYTSGYIDGVFHGKETWDANIVCF